MLGRGKAEARAVSFRRDRQKVCARRSLVPVSVSKYFERRVLQGGRRFPSVFSKRRRRLTAAAVERLSARASCFHRNVWKGILLLARGEQ